MPQPPPPRATAKSVWPVRDTWNRATENLYSAWIEKLFDAPLDAALSWPALHEVLRDKSRNFLFNHLGLGEDEKKLIIQPDCADLPYFLRAYFAFKMGLPFGYSKCSRGGGGQAPKCPAVVEHSEGGASSAPPEQKDRVRRRCSESSASRSRVRRPGFPRGRKGLCRGSDIICGRPSPTPSIPATGERRPATTTPIIIPCR